MKSLPSTEITQGNLKAISYHLKKGEAYGGISEAALAEFLSHAADLMKSYEDKVNELELEIIKLKGVDDGK